MNAKEKSQSVQNDFTNQREEMHEVTKILAGMSHS